MELHLNTYGSALRKKDDMFEVFVDEKKVKVAPQKISSILISNAVQISSDAIQLAMDHNIDVVMLDKYGNPYARVWFPRIGSTVLIRRRQLEMLSDVVGMDFIKRWVCLKIMNQYRFIKMLFSKREWILEEHKQKMELMRKYAISIFGAEGSLEELSSVIMGLEGSASRIYFSLLAMMLSERWRFSTRSTRPAKDAFNAFLNYAYGILYTKTEKALVIAGLDPYIGLLHSDNYNKKSFVFDFIENYRMLADEPVFYIFSKNKCKPEYLESVHKGVNLSTVGKRFFAPYFLEYLDQIIRYRNKNRRKIDMIQTDAHAFANFLIGNRESYLESSIAKKFDNFINPQSDYFENEEEEC
ncbi:MAG: CRISPR-associated endonuclease Cas1 [Candidatus Cloacimonetes bacterium]|jgi:CRISPR-associated protein Cas1|nr:CRISPR-associated endonuclease Cas1 [Candidatus Cloacimonadota bacterium]MCK9332771.1 CRISPR-associated endonuclease Cas1 [Candidatus Cloacimonadota bacterium]